MGPFRVPDVLFAVFAEDLTRRRDEVGCVVEGVVFSCFVCGYYCRVFWFGFDDCSGDDVDVQFFC
jgi:hypothetical protein